MSNFSDFDDSPPPSPPPEDEDDFPNDSFDDLAPPEEDGDEDVDNSLPPSDIDDGSFDDDIPPPSEDMTDYQDADIVSDEPSIPPSLDNATELSDFPTISGDDVQPVLDKNQYVVPVKTFRQSHQPTLDIENGHLDPLSSGLLIKRTPAIVKQMLPARSATPPDIPILSVSDKVEQNSGQESRRGSLDHSNKLDGGFSDEKRVLFEGYMWCLGKFEGDPFERLQVRIEGNIMLIRVASGEVIDFNLSDRAYVYEDTVEPRTLILDYKKTPVLLKFDSENDYIEFMKTLPEVVFVVQEEDSVRKAPPIDSDNGVSSKPRISPGNPKPVPRLQSQHVKGTSVEDILENGPEEALESKLLEFSPSVGNQVLIPVVPPRKKELADSHIRRPKYSVRRVSLICEWINGLKIWPSKVSVLTLHKEFVNGVLLARLVRIVNPDVQFVHLNEKALSKKAALENLEQALGHLWRSKSLNNSRIPSSDEIYNGDASKIAILLNEVFGVYVQRPLFKSALKVLRWYHHILKQYQRPLPSYVIEEGDLSGMWPHFQSGTALFCVLYHFFGAGSVSTGREEIRLDPLRIAGDPKSICEFRSNLVYVFDIFRLIGIEVLWTPEDWITNPDTEFILLQLSYLYERLKLKQCALPPAQGERPGLASGPNGEALVVGLVFNDAPSSLRFISRVKKSVRLGYDEESMPLLPIDQLSSNARYFTHGFLPRGMTSKDVRVNFVGLKLKEMKVYADKGVWNARTTVRTDKDTNEGNQVIDLLRSHHRRGKDDKDDSAKSVVTIKSNDFVRGLNRSKLNEASSESKDPTTLFSFDEYGQNISVLLKNLESEMLTAQKDIQQAEDTLASQYVELEASASSFLPDEYSRALDQLEYERLELEQEKERLKDYFARKLALIKERKEEVHKKAVDLKKQVSGTIEDDETEVSLKNISRSHLASSKQGMAKSRSQRDVKQVENGWIKLSSKMNTHNFHLRVKQEASVAAFQAKITPKHLIEKQDVSKSSSRPTGLEQVRFESAQDGISSSFQRFRERLKMSSDKWLQSRNFKTKSVVQEIIQSGIKNPTVELISLPDKSVHGNNSGFVHMPTTTHTQFSQTIRLEELTAMHYEDERRKMVQSEQEILRSFEHTQKLFVNQEPSATDDAWISKSPVNHNKLSFSAVSFNAAEFENILHFLVQPQVLTVCGRHSHEFIFELVEMELGGPLSFAWGWKDPYATVSGEQGFVALQDIASVSSNSIDDHAFLVAIVESAKALKNSQGRITLNLRAESSADRDKLVYAISYLLHMASLTAVNS